MELELVDPLLDTFTDVVKGCESSGAYGDASLVLDDGTPPLTNLSRFEQTSGRWPGDYWVSLAVAPADDRDPLDVPVELSVEVSGRHPAPRRTPRPSRAKTSPMWVDVCGDPAVRSGRWPG